MSLKTRKIIAITQSQPVLEGANVRLRRAFGFGNERQCDPFLLLDDFRSDSPVDYINGFPWHPHRGIETITYVLAGEIEHGDSLGNKGVIAAGDVQWMTSGSGIIHQEMPHGDPQGRMYGFQLWANLPHSHKMMAPRYREVKSDQIPEVTLPDAAQIRVICGSVAGQTGPVQDVVTGPEYLDITLPAHSVMTHLTPPDHTVIAYVIAGQACFGESDSPPDEDYLPGTSNPTEAGNCSLLVFSSGDQVQVTTGDSQVRFLFISGKPIGEPVAWYGPIVMNTRAELETAFREYQEGTFIKHG